MAWQGHQGEQRPKAALDHRLPGELGRIINPEDESPTGEPPAGQPTIPSVPEVVELARQFDTDANVDDRRMISSGDYAFDYDGSGNLTKVHGPGEALTFEFNAQRQLTGINGTHTYNYDLWGRRVTSSDSQTQEPLVFAWKDSRVIAIGQRSQGQVRWTHAIGYGPAGPVFMAGLQGNPSYLIATDHLGTPYGWVNAQTGKVYYTPYSPWGEPLFHGTYKVPTPPDDGPFPNNKSRKTEDGGFNIPIKQYVPQPYETVDGPVTPFEPPPDPLFGIAPLGLTGHFLDRSTGLIYMHHRYFSPRLGYFLTPDFRAPDIYDPTTFTEPYAYAAGNPIMFYDPDGRAVEYIGNGRVKIETRDIHGILQTLYMPQADWIKLVTGQAAGYGPYSQAFGYAPNPKNMFKLKKGFPDLGTKAGRAEYKARANTVLENFFGPGTELTKGTGETTEDFSAVVVNGSLLVFGLGAGGESGFAFVRGLTYTAEAGLSGYAVYDGAGNIYEGIQDGSVKQVAWGTFETATGALGGYGSVRALAGEIRAASGADLLVIDEALLDAYVAESLAPVAQRNTLVVSSSESNALRQRVLENIAKSRAARESSNFRNWAFTYDPSRLPSLPSVAFEARLPPSMSPGVATRPPAGWTWHHGVEPGQMLLVP